MPKPKKLTATVSKQVKPTKPFEDIACPICLEDDKDDKTRILPLGCGHWLHKSCAEGLIKAQCPLCRAPMNTIPKLLHLKIKNNADRDRIKSILLSSFHFRRRTDEIQALVYLTHLKFPFRPQTVKDAAKRVIARHEQADDMMIQQWVNNGQTGEHIPSIANDMITEIVLAMRQSPLPGDDDAPTSQINNGSQPLSDALLRTMMH